MDVMVATLMRWMFPMLLALAATLSVPSAHAEAKAVRHTIQRGETLSSIAAKYNTNVASICRWNAIKKTAMLTPGKKIGVPLPPGASAPKKSEAKKSGESWQSFKKTPDRPGYVKLVGYTGKWEGYAVGKGGKVIGNAREAFNDVLSSRRTKKEKDIDTRLIQLVAQVSDVFGGRTIHVVSGYRPGTHSKHSTGHVGLHGGGRAQLGRAGLPAHPGSGGRGVLPELLSRPSGYSGPQDLLGGRLPSGAAGALREACAPRHAPQEEPPQALR